jgi:SHS2 domain-containing protein
MVRVGMGYRILDHTADIGIEVHGATLTDLFSQAALALVDLLTDRTMLTGEAERIIRVAGADLEDLWINYLREILFLFNGDNFLVKGVRSIACEHSPRPGGAVLSKTEKSVVWEDDRNPILTPTLPGEGREANMVTGLSLVAHCLGDIYHPLRHAVKTEIKAVTYHRAAVKQTPEGWQGVFIVDV